LDEGRKGGREKGERERRGEGERRERVKGGERRRKGEGEKGEREREREGSVTRIVELGTTLSVNSNCCNLLLIAQHPRRWHSATSCLTRLFLSP
jgi:hypothetical protein